MATNLYAPITGEVKLSQNSQDSLFSANILGKGIVIFPTGCQVVSPFDGIYTQQSDHTITIESNDGGQWLLHLGLDFAGMTTTPVTYLFQNGANLVANTPLAIINWAQVQAASLDVEQEVALLNVNQHSQIIEFVPANYESGGIIGKLITSKGVN